MRLLVVYKQSFLEAHGTDRRLLARLSAAERSRLLRADIENRQSVRDVERHLRREGIRHDLVYRGRLAASPRYDLIVTVGGDGTFLTAAHYSHGTPILGVNSDPRHSLGLFTCTDRHGFARSLERALAGRMRAVKLNRFAVEVNGEPLPEFVLNDVLFAHRSPAIMSRYEIAADGRREQQRSSGLWISTAAGSTAAILAAGGRKMPIASKRIQHLTREPYGWPAPRYRLTHGQASRTVELTVLMDAACLWVDGSRLRHDVRLGDRVTVRTGAPPATVLGFDRARRDRLFR